MIYSVKGLIRMTSDKSQITTIDELLSEVQYLLQIMYPESNFELLEKAYYDVVTLFDGNYEGYKACNTPFHDLQHTLDCFLAMVRILHGAFIEGVIFTVRETELGLVAALMHDTGYIQTENDKDGSGAKYTLVHVGRSVKFLQQYFMENKYPAEDAEFCLLCINYTGLGTEIEEIITNGDSQDLMGQMLGTADLVGQMADHRYLEKLIFLAEEFNEGRVPGYESEEELLRKTKDFYLASRKLLENEYGSVVRFLKSHYEQRWNINRNVYLDAIHKQINYLEHILEKYPDGYHSHLKRKENSEIGWSERTTGSAFKK